MPTSAWLASSNPALKLRGTSADVRDADRNGRVELALDPADVLDQLFRAGRGDAHQRSHGIVSSIEERPGSSGAEQTLEAIVGRSCGDDEVALVEIAPEACRAPLQIAEDGASGQLLEEVLDEVLLRQPIDQLDLLDRDSGLVCDGPRQVDL